MTMIGAFQKSLSFATFSADTVPEPDRRAMRVDQFEPASRGELQMAVDEVLPLEPNGMDSSSRSGRLASPGGGIPSATSGRFLPGAGTTEVQAHSRGSRTRPVSRVMIVTARAVGLGSLAACDGRLVMGDALTITVRSERGVVIAAVTGEIDISTVAPLRKRLFELADSGGC